MKDTIKLGVVVADECEYAPLREMGLQGFKRADFYKREGHTFEFSKQGKKIIVHTVLCGIGMVNAAAAATFLAQDKCDIILNTGLSGGISGIAKNELTIGDKYIEHDFDLTPLGYEPCQKPLQNYIYSGDKDLINLFSDLYPQIKVGVAVSGDSFVSDNAKRDFLKNTFNAMSCDMESAAVAYVCENANIKYLALRRISDDAGDDATSSYTDMNELKEAVLFDLLFDAIKGIFDRENFWM